MRIDKFLKNSRLIKRRAIAKEACDGGRILINDKIVKAGADVGVGDIIKIRFGTRELTVRAVKLTESAGKDTAMEMYEVLSDESIDYD